ncbi:gephyrin-like molybdotransferase Glp [Paraglaciecola sp. MB-3u-78]|uniref:molybdopterin molybdotransferase MoeA n=1 Tax=Paraglaciecola sp. MB-3u-78 TaxID=2058332 RepID=UPI000C33C8AE|nr:gephyrin-like molybdotransferase Glp [Paraglaciecola sp. MB-3u-78]PKG96736.1 molybdopterin molybdenumtransferase MoeA [Paraglaciecola sp. MB-3u-78]
MIETCDSPGLLPIQSAIYTMLKQVHPILESEQIELEDSLGRVLAVDVESNINVPPNDNSAMDGYAMRCEDLIGNNTLQLVGTALAGAPFRQKVLPGQCIRIMTGAVIPQGADSVVMQENTETKDGFVIFKQIPEFGNSVRKAGEDIQQGMVVVTKGTKLTPAYLALIASVGMAEISVIRNLKVGLIATGDELTPPGQALTDGAIYESNRYALTALLKTFPVVVFDFGIVKDNKDDLKAVFEQAGSHCDLVLSCGGVSVGDADYVKEILDDLGSINFWKVAIKPGKPFAFGQLGKACFCGLPGNPVSSYVTFEQLVTPVLQKLSGQTYRPTPHFVAKAACLIKKRPGRADYQRGIFYRDGQGELLVKPNGKQGSGIMSSIANANCYMVLEQDTGDVQVGENVNIQPF